MSVAYWSTPEGRRLQDYCCQKSMPRGAIKADLSKQSPNNACGPPMRYGDQKRVPVNITQPQEIFRLRRQP